jgi:hypothetical protein
LDLLGGTHSERSESCVCVWVTRLPGATHSGWHAQRVVRGIVAAPTHESDGCAVLPVGANQTRFPIDDLRMMDGLIGRPLFPIAPLE